MSTLATLIAIAAWCGYPNGDYGQISVNGCRQEIHQCLEKTPKNPDCFLNYQLKSNKRDGSISDKSDGIIYEYIQPSKSFLKGD